MSTYIYSSRETFLARCWWQSIGDDTTPVVEGNAVAKERLAAIWLETGARNHRDHWNRYLQSTKDGELKKRLAPSDYVTPEHQYYELFWFGAYTQGSPRADSQRFYEIRPADRVWTVFPWVLDYSMPRFSGYVGIWPAAQPQGALRKESGAGLWAVEGLPAEPARGERFYNLRLIAPGGERVKRYPSEGSWFFNSRKGEAGFIAMEILSIPHQFGEI
ncbi:hypothetical protein [Pseudomonas fluorescens]|jgi:hypothetical protein|uniref:hypothetical protein n=1 Tax=Pseudomonas fluorescens TaxID=294 RepID=UPI0020C3A9CD|nr:hypothetical protein [Pseudomonas fluorescens]UTL89403.1 hypothetical protein NLL86_18285 [Pseudomonas fluorescens]